MVIIIELYYHIRACRWRCYSSFFSKCRVSEQHKNTSLPYFLFLIFHVDKHSGFFAQCVIIVEHKMDFTIRAATLEDCKDISRMILVSRSARVSYACV